LHRVVDPVMTRVPLCGQDYVCAKLGMAVPLGGGGLTGEWVLLVTEHRLILVDVLTLEV
jgi:hypothetical protein